jgi:hypothetical protein
VGYSGKKGTESLGVAVVDDCVFTFMTLCVRTLIDSV